MILYGTFRDGPPGTDASFTLANYVRAYGDASILVLAANTMVFAVGAAVVSFVLGGFLAWVTERTDTPLKSVIYGLALFPFVIPGILTTVAWVLLLSPKIGLINRLLIDNFALAQAPFNIYSMAGMIWVFGIDNITLPFFLLAASFRSMDPALEEAGRVSGMGALVTFWHVNLKLLTPTIFAVLLLLMCAASRPSKCPLSSDCRRKSKFTPARSSWRCACFNPRIITWRELTRFFTWWWHPPAWGCICGRLHRRKNSPPLRERATGRAPNGLAAGATYSGVGVGDSLHRRDPTVFNHRPHVNSADLQKAIMGYYCVVNP